MYDIMFLIGIICAFLAGVLLIFAIIAFFAFNIPRAKRELHGKIGQKQINKIRQTKIITVSRYGRPDVFGEPVYNTAVPVIPMTPAPVAAHVPSAPTVPTPAASTDHAVSVQAASAPVNPAVAMPKKQGPKKINSEFIIEQSIIFVSTDEIM